jgi:hypothetical protein
VIKSGFLTPTRGQNREIEPSARLSNPRTNGGSAAHATHQWNQVAKSTGIRS